MTNPFAASEPRPASFSDANPNLVSEAAARDTSENLIDFPSFEAEIPPVTRSGSSGPQLPSDPALRAVVEALLSFEPEKQCKAVGFTRTGNKDTDEVTKTLASKASLAARKFGVKVISRTVPHPHDVNKPAHQKRYIVALWRAKEEVKA